jgi:hypothetical protein
VAAFTLSSGKNSTRSSLKSLYEFLSDFKNFAAILPQDKVENFKFSGDECSFSIKGITPMTIKMAEKKPFEKLVFTSEGLGKFNFQLTANFIGEAGKEGICEVILNGDLNPFIKTMAEKPLLALVNTMCQRLAEMTIT